MKYRKGYDYQLAETITVQTSLRPPQIVVTEFITLTPSGLITIQGGYAWDGASGPTINTDNTMTPSLVHDAEAQLMRLGLLDRKWRIPSNEDFGRRLKKRGMFWLRRKTWVKMLNAFGAPSTDPANAKKVYEVV